MRKRIRYKVQILTLLLCLTFGMAIVSHAETTQDKLNDTASKIDELEQRKQEKEKELERLNQYKSNLSGELQQLDTQLYNISADLEELEQQLDVTNASIAEKEAGIEKMEKKSEEQYENMKRRIKYIYENGQGNIMEILLASKSISDFLNRSEYAAAITNYDRDMLDVYIETLHAIEDEKERLEEKRQEEEYLKKEKEEKQNEVHTLIEEKKVKINAAQGQISDAENTLGGYEEEIEKQKAYEDELEKKKEKEEAERLEQLRKQKEQGKEQDKGKEKQQPEDIKVIPAQGDEALLAAIIECEAGGEIYEGKLAVGSVVMNRVASSSFPNTVVGVIYQSGQFSPVASGRFATVLAKGAGSSSVKAAKEVLAGKRTIDALYFRTNNGLIDGTIIGNHVFY